MSNHRSTQSDEFRLEKVELGKIRSRKNPLDVIKGWSPATRPRDTMIKLHGRGSDGQAGQGAGTTLLFPQGLQRWPLREAEEVRVALHLPPARLAVRPILKWRMSIAADAATRPRLSGLKRGHPLVPASPRRSVGDLATPEALPPVVSVQRATTPAFLVWDGLSLAASLVGPVSLEANQADRPLAVSVPPARALPSQPEALSPLGGPFLWTHTIAVEQVDSTAMVRPGSEGLPSCVEERFRARLNVSVRFVKGPGERLCAFQDGRLQSVLVRL